ncbi:MAG: hypothetical protein ACYSUT_12525 [Planctomycetota bacterium]|jgi:negative regulator of sigma E activity
MNQQNLTIRIEELTLKSFESQLTADEQAELATLLKTPPHLAAYQQTIRTIASLQDLDGVTGRIENQLNERPLWLRPVIQLTAAACITIAVLTGIKWLNRLPVTIDSPVVETFFSQSEQFDQRMVNLHEKIRQTTTPPTMFMYDSYQYKRVDSEIKTLKETPVFGKENGDV